MNASPAPARSQTARTEGHLAPSRIAAYFDGALSRDRLDAVEQHLGVCSDCRGRLAVMTGARQAVRYLPLPEVPEKVWNRIAGQLERRAPKQGGRPSSERGPAARSDAPNPENAALNPENAASNPGNDASEPGNAASEPENAASEPENAAPNPENGASTPASAGPVRRLSGPTPTDHGPIGRSRADASAVEEPEGPTSWRWLAASVVLVLAGAVLIVSPLDSDLLAAVGPAEKEGIDYGRFIAGHSSSDELESFATTYRRQRLALTTKGALTQRLVGSDLLGSYPGGLRPRAAYTLSDDGIRATQVTYVRQGTTVEVFRQPADHPARFDGFKAKQVTIAGAECLKISDAGIQAATFTAGKARFVVVGRQGDRAFSSVIADLRRSTRG